MASYSVVASDGNRYTIEAPEGLSQREVREIVDFKLGKRGKSASVDTDYIENYDADYNVLDEFEEFFKGIPRGAVNMGELAAKGIAEGFDADQETLDAISSVAESARSPFAQDTGAGGDTYIGGTIGDALGGTLPMGIMAAMGPLGWGAAGATALAAGAGEATTRAREAGATEEEIDQTFLPGLMTGGLDLLPISRILGRAGSDIVEKAWKRYGKAFLEEGSTEGISATIQNLIEQQVYNPEADLVNMDVIKEAGVGGTVGLILQGLADAALKGRRAPKTPEAPAEPETLNLPAPDSPTPLNPDDPLYMGEEGQDLTDQVIADMEAERAATAEEKRKIAQEEALRTKYKDTPLTDIEDKWERQREANRRMVEERELAQPTPSSPLDPARTSAQRALPDQRGIAGLLTPPDAGVNAGMARAEQLQKQDAANRAAVQDTALNLNRRNQADVERATDTRDRMLNRGRTQQDLFPMGAGPEGLPPLATVPPLNKPRPADPRQRDMVAEDEAAQVEEMYAADEAKKARDVEREQVAEQARTDVATRMKDNEVAQQEEQRSAQARKAVIDEAIAKVDSPDMNRMQRAASAELRRRGYTGGALTDAERAAIAQESYKRSEAQPTVDTGADNAGMEAMIPEKGANQVGGMPNVEALRTDQPSGVGGSPAPSQPVPVVGGAGSDTGSTTAPVMDGRGGLGASDRPASGLRGRDAGTTDTLEVPKDGDQQQQPSKAGSKPAKQKAPAQNKKGSRRTKPAAKQETPKQETPKRKTRPASKETVAKNEAEAKEKTKQDKQPRKQYKESGQFLTQEEADRIERGGVKDEYYDLVLSDRQYESNFDPSVKYVNQYPRNTVPDVDHIPIFNIVQGSPAQKSDAAYAKRYFATKGRSIDAMVNIAYDNVFGPTDGRQAPAAKAAERWVVSTLSPEGVAVYDKIVRDAKKARDKQAAASKHRNSERIERQLDARRKLQQQRLADDVGKSAKYTRSQIADIIDDIDTDDYLEFYKRSTGADAFRPLHPEVQQALAAGDLTRAMRLMEMHAINPQLRGIISALSRVLVRMNTKVEVVPADGKIGTSGTALGVFQSGKNTIQIRNSLEGMTPHTLLHEVTHAVTVHTIETSPNMPAVKKLNALYQSLKAEMGEDWYAFKNLKEFVAEAYTNPEFQRQLDNYGVKVDGKPTKWQQFLDSVVKIVQKLTGVDISGYLGRSESVRDAAIREIESIMQPWEGGKDYGAFYLEDKIVDTRGRIDNMTTKGMDRAVVLIERHGPKMRSILRSVLPLSSLSSMIERKFGTKSTLSKLAREFEVLTRQMSAAMGKRQSQLEVGYNQVIRPWRKNATPAQLQAMDDMIADATVNQIDPSMTMAEAKKAYENQPMKLAKYRELRSKYDSLGKSGQDAYRTMANTLDSQFSEILSVLEGTANSDGVEEASRRVFKEALDTIRKAGRIKPYFPLTREGNFVLGYTDPRNNEYYEYAFTTEAERRAARQEVASQIPKIKFNEYIRTGVKDFANAPPTSFMYQLGKVLDSNEVQPEVVDQIMRLYMDSLPERSILKGFQERKGVLGFERDATAVFRKKTLNLANQLTQMEYGAKLSKWEGKINEAMMDRTGELHNNASAIEWANELKSHVGFAKNPRVHGAAKLLTGMGFAMTLGLNISSALVNLAQIPTVMLPYFGGRYGFKESTKAFSNAMNVLRHSGNKRKIMGVGPNGAKEYTVNASFGLDNYDFSDPNTPAEIKRYETLTRIADEQGQLNRSIAYDVLDVDGLDSKWSRFNAVSGFMFHHAERLNRQAGLMAAYDLHLQKLKKDAATKNLPEAELEALAAQEAINLVAITNGDAHAAGAPRIAQNNVGRVAFLFKRYGVTMYYLLGKTMKDMVVGKDAEAKREARKQFTGMIGGSMLIAGAQGVPLYGAAAMLHDLMKEDDEEDFDTVTRQLIGDEMFTGALNTLTGWEFSSRVGLSDLIFRDPFMAHEKTAMQIAVEFIGGPVFGIANSWNRGATQIAEGDFMKGAQSFAPASLRSVLKTFEGVSADGKFTARGDKVMDYSAGELVGQMLGFTPSEYALKMKENSLISALGRDAGEAKRKISQRLYTALRLGNSDDVAKLIRQIIEYNQRWPEFAITNESLRDAMNAHERTTGEMYQGVRIDPRLQPRIQRILSDIEN